MGPCGWIHPSTLPVVLLNHVPPRVVRQAGSQPGPGKKLEGRPVVMVKGARPQRTHRGLSSLSHAVSLFKMSNEILSLFFFAASSCLSLSLSPPHSQPGLSHRAVCLMHSVLGVNEDQLGRVTLAPGGLQANTITFMAA